MISESQIQFSRRAAAMSDPAAAAGLADLCTRLEGQVNRLTEMRLDFARQRPFNPHVSTLPEAWRASIVELNGAIAATVAAQGARFYDHEDEIGADPAALYGLDVARRHGLRGVTLGMFLGNFKTYRDTYLKWAGEQKVPAGLRDLWGEVLRGFFDRAEIALSTGWGKEVVDVDRGRLFAENQRLMNEKNKYLTIFESIHNPVVLIDAEGRVENMNFAAARLFSEDVIPGATYYGAVAPPPFVELFGFALADLEGEVPEREIATCGGRRRFAISTQEMLDVSRKFLGTVVSLTDVTEQHRARQEAEALAQAKTDFLATMSHEIRTPIHSIGGVVELMRQGALDPVQADYLEAIARSARVMSSIVSEILDYSRIEAGGLALEAVPFSLEQLLDDMRQVIEPLVERKPAVRLMRAPYARMPCLVGDPGKLRQILINLLGNAVKFTEAGVVMVGIEQLAETEAGLRLRFSVRDTGPGIVPERLEEIFKPFTQSDGSIERKHGGTGLGLAISRRLAALMGAELGVESTPGVGSCFTLDVTLGRAADTGQACGAVEATELPRRALQLLIVEDDPVNRLVAGGLLRQAGHRVQIMPSGEAALQALTGQEFDLVLTDLNLPDLSGFELARAIRAHADPAVAKLPIIAMSAHGPAVDPAALDAAGIGGFLAKPFQFARLEAVLQRVTGVAAPRPLGGPPAPQARPDPGGLVDLGVLRDHRSALGAGPTERIVSTFVHSVQGTAHELELAAQTGEWQQAGMIAHRLKSSARHVGLNALAEEAERVERRAVQGAKAYAPIADLALSCRAAAGLVAALWKQIEAEA
ncbi:hybrid sensor histidine kinase/response regulator [Rhodobacter maris]|uniref:histidine kinase n=1 Tax=Rhodobacter maris TaxID=446682 RepID=A0A285SS36_9RHOB|nr:PAS domain-containing hybrid sensor histidine kinase/response regulator [Rhodobacter maris]SOC09082.1 signal transduction histidine kinase [Rhodobacter maris]